jgi:hypothetical protein
VGCHMLIVYARVLVLSVKVVWGATCIVLYRLVC